MTWLTLLLSTPPTNIILVLIIAAVAVLTRLLLVKPPNLLRPQVAILAGCFPFRYRWWTLDLAASALNV